MIEGVHLGPPKISKIRRAAYVTRQALPLRLVGGLWRTVEIGAEGWFQWSWLMSIVEPVKGGGR
jgi:hypothetical protein